MLGTTFERSLGISSRKASHLYSVQDFNRLPFCSKSTSPCFFSQTSLLLPRLCHSFPFLHGIDNNSTIIFRFLLAALTLCDLRHLKPQIVVKLTSISSCGCGILLGVLRATNSYLCALITLIL